MFSFCKKKKKLELRYFTLDEFECNCGCGGLPELRLMLWADDVRHTLGLPMRINSAYRCPDYNKKIGGAPASQHPKGLAIDVHCPDDNYKAALIRAMESHDVVGLGLYPTFIHGDLRNDIPARWSKN